MIFIQDIIKTYTTRSIFEEKYSTLTLTLSSSLQSPQSTVMSRVVSALEVAAGYRDEIKAAVADAKIANTGISPPKLVAFLANSDPAAKSYAQWTEKTCRETGIVFELRTVPRTELEAAIVNANEDDSVSGIMVYYPVFGDPQDQYIQSVVDRSKDVEGTAINLY